MILLVPSRIALFKFDMLDITTVIPSLALGFSMDRSVRLEGMMTPYLTHRFGSGHIQPSTLFIGGFSLSSSDLNTSVHYHGGGVVLILTLKYIMIYIIIVYFCYYVIDVIPSVRDVIIVYGH